MKNEDSPFKEVWEEIRAGKNIGVYLAVPVLFIMPLLSVIFPGFMKENLSAVIWTVMAAILVILLQIHWNLKKFTAASDSELLDSLKESGLQMYYPKRRDYNFEQIIENAKSKFDSIGTSLPDIAHERCWKSLRDEIVRKPKLKVRILLVNPYSQIAAEKKQSNIYKDDSQDIIRQIEQSISKFTHVFNDLSKKGKISLDRYDVRLYSTIPTVSCVFNDEILDIAFYDENEPASITPAWKFVKNESEKGLYNYYQKNFEKIWEDERTISIFSDKKLFDKQKSDFYRKEQKLLSMKADSIDNNIVFMTKNSDLQKTEKLKPSE